MKTFAQVLTLSCLLGLILSGCGNSGSSGNSLAGTGGAGGTTPPPGGNTPPTITSTAPTSGTVGTAYAYQATATDAQGDPIAWTLPTAPAGMTVSATGLVNWTPSTAGSFNVTLRASDGQANAQQNWTIVVASASGGGGLPASVTLTQVGQVPNGMLVLSDMQEFDGKLYIAAAQVPLGSPFGAGIYYYNGSTVQTAHYDSGSQGYLRTKVYNNKLYVPDGDPNGLTPGYVYVFSPGSTTPQQTSVTGAVHNFDVTEFGGQLYVSGSNNSGQSTLHRFNSSTSVWDQVSTGAYGRLKYLATFDNQIWSSKQVQSGVDGVWVGSNMTQQGFVFGSGGGNLIPCLEQIDNRLYMVVWGSSGLTNIIVNPGLTTTAITGVTGIMWDIIKHTDGNYYMVSWDGTNDKIYGSTDGIAFTQLYSAPGSVFGQPGSNADGRPSIASYNGKVYVGSSTNGRVYRLD
ncbi:MAG: hypothetical protein KF696_14195 [Planctomycetes bacterium]|nr:hypothetical protein [Planctomycetota bacterium]MCW8136854.1 hypothetical protein [Planctomycetota bacterium]